MGLNFVLSYSETFQDFGLLLAQLTKFWICYFLLTSCLFLHRLECVHRQNKYLMCMCQMRIFRGLSHQCQKWVNISTRQMIDSEPFEYSGRHDRKTQVTHKPQEHSLNRRRTLAVTSSSWILQIWQSQKVVELNNWMFKCIFINILRVDTRSKFSIGLLEPVCSFENI